MARRFAVAALAGLVACLGSGHAPWAAARAADLVAPPVMPAPDAWVGRGQALVRVLDKLDAGTAVLTLTPGEAVHYKSLSIKVGRCLSRPDGLPPDAAAWVQIDDDRPDSAGFANWLFVAEPSLVMFENPVYGVTLIGCDGARLQTYKGHDYQPAPVPVPSPPPDAGAATLPMSPGGAGAPQAGSGTGALPAAVPPADAVPGIPDPNAPDAPAGGSSTSDDAVAPDTAGSGRQPAPQAPPAQPGQ